MNLISRIDPNSILAYLGELFTYDPQHPLLFNSGQFLLLFLLFFGGYLYVANARKVRTLYVILFSLFFYYKSSGVYFVLLIASTVVDYALGFAIHGAEKKARKRGFLILSLLANLGMLAYFKYTNLLLETFQQLAGGTFETLDIFLPVGISFYTFQTMSYSIDVYRGKLEPCKDFLEFAFFVTFFPQLVAGPIVRAADFLPQIRDRIQVSLEDTGRGFLLICSGLFKKAVISDYIGINFVDRIFEAPALYSGLETLLGVYGYALQIYCDFSGYSDIAIGLGLLMGFRLPDNFCTPYRSASIREFWRRWHISLSSWLRDYLYISLGGNRKGKFRTYLNLLITMLLGGLWHGASWKFMMWGGMHGLALALERAWGEYKTRIGDAWNGRVEKMDKWVMRNWIRSPKPVLIALGVAYDELGNLYWFFRSRGLPFYRAYLKRPLGIVLTFHFVCFCWIFFRAESFALALEVIGQISGSFHISLIRDVFLGYKEVFYLMLLGYLLHFVPDRVDQRLETAFIRSPMVVQSLTLACVIWLILQAQTADVQPFIYFQF